MNNPHLNPAKLDPAAVSTASPRHIQSVIEDLVELLGSAVAAEREACAQECDLQAKTISTGYGSSTAMRCARRIRARLTNPSSVA